MYPQPNRSLRNDALCSTVQLLLADARVTPTEEGLVRASKAGHERVVAAILSDGRLHPGIWAGVGGVVEGGWVGMCA